MANSDFQSKSKDGGIILESKEDMEDSDAILSAGTAFNVVDLSKLIVPSKGIRADYIRAEQIDVDGDGSLDLRLRVSASGKLNGTPGAAADETSITLNGVTYATLNAQYGINSVTDSETALAAMLLNQDLLLGSDLGMPSVNLPQDQVVVEGDTLVFDGVDSIVVADDLADGMANLSQVVTVVAQLRDAANTANPGVGSLTLGGSHAPGLAVTGSTTSMVTLQGTVAQVNSALANLNFRASTGNNSADQVLRVSITDNDGKTAQQEIRLVVSADVQNAATISAETTRQLLANGSTNVNLKLKLNLPAATDGEASGEQINADGSERYELVLGPIPSWQVLAGWNPAKITSVYNPVSNTYTLMGTAADLATAATALQIQGVIGGGGGTIR